MNRLGKSYGFSPSHFEIQNFAVVLIVAKVDCFSTENWM